MAKEDILATDCHEYEQWLQRLCEEIDRQKLKAMMQLNSATLQHYWWMGNDILHKQKDPDFPFVQVQLAQLERMPVLQTKLATWSCY